MRMIRLFSFLALIAIALRAVTPAGYMVGVDETTGLVKMEICHGGLGMSFASYWLDPDSGEMVEDSQSPQDHSGQTDPCPYASLTMLDLPNDAPVFDPQQVAYLLGAKPVTRTILSERSRRLLPPLRGPPLHV